MFKVQLKKLNDQVIVITGASSGIGLATAKMAAEKGARILLSSRNEAALRQVCDEIRAKGGQAEYVVADVANAQDVQRIADTAIRKFGGFDTWVNNAGISIFGKLTETHLDEKKRLFDVNFWGVVNGCRAAIPHLRQRGGALINIGSVLSDRAIPLQGMYSASKHAVKAYTDALRMELEKDGAPVSVTLVKPSSIDTLYEEHARSKMGVHPALPPPLYAPEVVADAILRCAEHPRRDITIGMAKMFDLVEKFAPRFLDILMEATMFRSQKTRKLAPRQDDGLFAPSSLDARARSGHHRAVLKHSLGTEAAFHPILTGLALAGIGAAAYFGMRYAGKVATWREGPVTTPDTAVPDGGIHYPEEGLITH